MGALLKTKPYIFQWQDYLSHSELACLTVHWIFSMKQLSKSWVDLNFCKKCFRAPRTLAWLTDWMRLTATVNRIILLIIWLFLRCLLFFGLPELDRTSFFTPKFRTLDSNFLNFVNVIRIFRFWNILTEIKNVFWQRLMLSFLSYILSKTCIFDVMTESSVQNGQNRLSWQVLVHFRSLLCKLPKYWAAKWCKLKKHDWAFKFGVWEPGTGTCFNLTFPIKLLIASWLV